MDDERIILCVQQRKAIYDKSDPKHSSRKAVNQLWRECARELEIEVETAKKRWSYLRDYFLKQYRTLKFTESGEPATRKKKWPLFDTMLFLVPHVQHHQDTFWNFVKDANNVSGMEEEDETTNDGSVPIQDEFTTESISIDADPFCPDTSLDDAGPPCPSTDSSIHRPQKRPGASCLQPQLSKLYRSSATASSSFDSGVHSSLQEPSDLDDHEHFLKSLLPTMRKLDPFATLEFRIDVQRLLLRYVKQSASSSSTTGNINITPLHSSSPTRSTSGVSELIP